VTIRESRSLDDGRVTFDEPVDRHVTDPVCGATVDPNDVRTFSAEYEGATVHFCSAECKRRFLEDPDAYRRA